jgi:hypothetical protein
MPRGPSPTVAKRARRMADNAVKQLEVWCKSGLPECYKTLENDALCDWYPDLPWEPEGLVIAAKHIIGNHGEVLDLVQEKFQFDMRADLQKAIQEAS